MSWRSSILAVLAAACVAVPAAALTAPSGGSVSAAVTGPGAGPAVAYAGPTGRVALRGDWIVRLDPADHGTTSGWQRGRFGGRRVSLPYSPNAGHVTGEAGKRSFAGSVAWYRTMFTVHRAGSYAVRFESVNHRAAVWIDGREVVRHTGAYMPFEARPRLAAGRHALVVRADWRNPDAMKADAWHRTWFNFGGIDREVTIRPLGASELDAPDIQTRLRVGAAVADVSVHVSNRAGRRSIRVEGALSHGGSSAPLVFPEVELALGAERFVHARVRIARPVLWAPGHPELYRLRLEVPGESGYVARVGLREIRSAGGRLLLNGRAVRLQGASLQEDAEGRGDALLPADMDAIVRRLRAIGANATRSQHPGNPALLEQLDAAGVLVWQGIGPVDAPGAWTSVTPRLQARAQRRVRLNVLQARLHPSVVAWNLANEVADNGHAGGQAAYVDAAARAVHRLDPGRLVAVDVWGTHLPAVAGWMYRNIDAVGATDYTGWYADTHAPGRVVAADIHAWLARVQRLFPRKVLVVTEFGAEANDLNSPGAAGSPGFQSGLLARHIRIYQADPRLSGMLIWNLQDFALAPTFAGGSIRHQVPGINLIKGINQKGLFAYGGRAKPAVAVVRRLYERRPPG